MNGFDQTVCWTKSVQNFARRKPVSPLLSISRQLTRTRRFSSSPTGSKQIEKTRTVLWLLSMGIFDKAYAQETAGSTDEHTNVAPDLFTAETPLGTYQGLTDQVVLSRTPGSFRTVLVPRGSSKPEWLES
jgi:hypothetical protein